MRLRILALLSVCIALAACNKINQENYSRIKAGMAKTEVEQLIGEPTECSGAVGLTSCTWGDQHSFISIQFAADKVVMYQGKGLK